MSEYPSPVLLLILAALNLVTAVAVAVQIWLLILNRRDMRSRHENDPTSSIRSTFFEEGE